MTFDSNESPMKPPLLLVVIPQTENAYAKFTIKTFNSSTYSSPTGCYGVDSDSFWSSTSGAENSTANDEVFGTSTSAIAITGLVFLVIAIIALTIAIIAVCEMIRIRKRKPKSEDINQNTSKEVKRPEENLVMSAGYNVPQVEMPTQGVDKNTNVYYPGYPQIDNRNSK